MEQSFRQYGDIWKNGNVRYGSGEFNVRLKPSKRYFEWGQWSSFSMECIWARRGFKIFPTSVSTVRSFVGMVITSFQDSHHIWDHLLNWEIFSVKVVSKREISLQNGQESRWHIIRAGSSWTPHFVHDASTKAVGGFLMQVQGGREALRFRLAHVIRPSK